MHIFYACIFLLAFNANVLFANGKIEVDLRNDEKKIYSQNGEDGIIEAIFNIVGNQSRYFVEFGGYDGYGMSNTQALRKKGWQGLLMDVFYENLEINLRKEFITAENINELFQKYQVPYDLDLLSIDIDFNDFYVWQKLSQKYQPRLVIIEYNAAHLPYEDKVVKYDPNGAWDYTNYFGASILALYNLGRTKGYSLVYVDQNGVNLFFVRNDLIENSSYTFKNINNVAALYVLPKYGLGPNGGHAQDPQNREYVKSKDLLNNEVK